MSAAFDVATLIAAGGFATLADNLGVNAFMDKGDNEMAVFEYSGLPDTMTHGGGAAFEHPRIQVQVRNVSAAAGWTAAYAVYRFIRGKMDQSVNGHTYQYFESLSYPHILSRDEASRPIYICEFQAHRSPE